MSDVIPLATHYEYVPDFTLGDRLRRAREACGLTQTELADAIGISQRSISSYEGDISIPNLLTLRMWGAVCQVNLSWLAWGDKARAEPMPADWKPRKMRATRSSTTWKQRTYLVDKLFGSPLVAAKC
jgi:transcriptional regulator with XRE-family HTH domain